MSFRDYLKESKSVMTGSYVAPKGSPNFTDHKYKDIATEGYRKNPYVLASIRLISNSFASIKPILYRMDSKGEKQRIKEHELLTRLQNPNEDQGWFEFAKEAASFFLLAGKNFTQITAPTSGANKGKPKGLYNLVPSSVDIVSGGPLNPIGKFKVRADGTSKVTEVSKDSMIYVKDFDPLMTYEGHSSAKSASRAIDANNAMMGYNLQMLQNGGVPPLVIYGAHTEQQVNQMREGWHQNYAGWQSAGEPFFPKGDVKIEPLGMNLKDAEWLEGLQLTGRLIMMAYNVPPEMLGDPDSKQRANYEQAEKSFYVQCIIPLWRMFLDAYNKDLVSKYDENLVLDIDLKGIEAMQQDKESLHKIVRQDLLAGIVNRKEAREETGRDEENSGINGDAFRVPVNVILESEEGTSGLEQPEPLGNNEGDSEPSENEEENADR